MDYINDFKMYLKSKDKTDNTIASYVRDIQEFVYWYNVKSNNASLTDIIELDVVDYKKHLQNTGLKVTSINRKLSSINAFLEWMYSNNYIQDSIKIKTIKNGDTIQFKALTDRELWALRKEVHRGKNKLHICILEILLNTGIRVSELCNIKLQDIQLSPRKGTLTVYGKGNKVRTIPLNVDVCKAIRDYLAVRKDIKGNDYLLIGQRGELKRNAIYLILKKYGNRIGVKISPHKLRHTLGYKLIRNPEVQITTIKDILGHERLETVMIYTQTTEEDKQKALEHIEW